MCSDPPHNCFAKSSGINPKSQQGEAEDEVNWNCEENKRGGVKDDNNNPLTTTDMKNKQELIIHRFSPFYPFQYTFFMNHSII